MSSPLSYLGTPDASTTVRGKVELATVAECTTGTDNTRAVTPLGLAAVAIAGAPAASTSQPGIIEIATNAEAAAQASGSLALVPSNIPSIMAAAGAIGGTTPAAGSFTDLTASGGTVSLSSSAAGNLTATGAGIDMSIVSDAGRVVINGEEAAADAVRILSAAGGLDVDVALQMSLVSSQNAADAVVINASAGGIDIIAAGAAGEDLDLTCTSGSVHITAGEAASDAVNIDSTGGFDLDAAEQVNIASSQNAANAIVITASVGGIDITAPGASAGEDIDIVATGSSVNITSTENAADSIVITSTLGGIDILASGAAAGEDIDIVATGSSVNITSTESAADSIKITSTAGGIDILASGAAAGEDIDIVATGSSVNISSSESAADSITIISSAGGIDILASGAAAGEDIDIVATGSSVNITSTEDVSDAIYIRANAGTSEAIKIHADQGTGVASLNLLSDVGGITLRATGLASADAINLEAAAGGIDVDAALQINIASSQNAVDAIRIISSAGGIDIDAVGAATEDINITNTGGSIVLVATESIADAIVLNASGAAGGIDLTTGGGSIDLSSSGFVTVAPTTDTVASPTATSTQNVNVLSATFTGFTTASAASQEFTITNSIITTSSSMFVTACNEGANDAQMTVMRVKRAAGSAVVTLKNNGAAALNGNVTITAWVIKA
ncbi:MAG TPA: hypothetical protein VL443_29495 [Cyclobacteriaceae bacterium]|nr:hypothetical protein [Cyclobacteriaceae bacterium]